MVGRINPVARHSLYLRSIFYPISPGDNGQVLPEGLNSVKRAGLVHYTDWERQSNALDSGVGSIPLRQPTTC